jgi:class 3 adenylate cyclase
MSPQVPLRTGPRKTQRAHAIIYADIKGFTSALASIESRPDESRRRAMSKFVTAWAAFRDALVRPTPSDPFARFYLANRVGDAFIILVFTQNASVWMRYVTEHLHGHFESVRKVMKQLDPDSDPRLKVSAYTDADQRVRYYETEVMAPQVIGNMTIARRDFFCTAINKCARMDTMPEADHSLLLCNKHVRDFLVDACPSLEITAFRPLGTRPLHGFADAEAIYSLPADAIG